MCSSLCNNIQEDSVFEISKMLSLFSLMIFYDGKSGRNISLTIILTSGEPVNKKVYESCNNCKEKILNATYNIFKENCSPTCHLFSFRLQRPAQHHP